MARLRFPRSTNRYRYRSGALNKRITIYSRTRNDDGRGGATYSLTQVAKTWCSAEELSTSQKFFAQQILEDASYSFVLRYPTTYTLTTNNIVEYRGVKRKVLSVRNHQEADRWVEVIAGPALKEDYA